MAKIKIDLSKYKASGVYTLEFDASESIVLNTQTVRLLVGFSRKGPFNSPVYLPDKKTARDVFGEIDPFLERRGAFFHRGIYTALDVGPVFGLNLMPLNNDPDFGDKVPYYSYSLSTTERNGVKAWNLYSSFYNKERFWYPHEDEFLANVNNHPINKGKLFNIVNLGQTPISIIVKKNTEVKGFNITAKEWFGKGNVPTFIDEWDFISDYFVDIIVIEGDWSKYGNLSIDPVFSEYFDIRGLKKGVYKNFLASPEVKSIGTFTGCLIPDLVDGNGVTHSVDNIINNSIARTGVFIAIDKSALENYDISANTDDTDNISAVDIIGHNFANPDRENPDIIDFLSYKTSIKEKLAFTFDDTFSVTQVTSNIGDYFATESTHLGKQYGYLDNVLVIPKPLVADDASDSEKWQGFFSWFKYMEIKNTLVKGHSLIKLRSDKWAKVENIYEEVNADNGRIYLKLVYSYPTKALEKDITGVKFNVQNFTGSMAIFINRGDVPAGVIDRFEDPTSYPKVGQDILLENRNTKTYFYAKVKATVTEDSYSTVDGTKNMVRIDVYDTEALDTLAQTGVGFYAYWSSIESVNPMMTLSIVKEPSIFKFVQKGGTITDPSYFVAYKFSKIYKYFDDGALLPGDKYYWAYNDPNFHYLNYEKGVDADGISILKIYGYDTYIDGLFDYDSTLISDSGANILPSKNYIRGINTPVDYVTEGIYIYGIADNLYDPVNVISWNNTKTVFRIKPEYSKQIEIGHYIVAEIKDQDGNSTFKLTKVINKVKKYDMALDGWSYEYTVNQAVRIVSDGGLNWVTRYYPMDSFIKYYQLHSLEGFKLTDYHLPGGINKVGQLRKILEVLDPINSNLVQMLEDRDIITFRYIVDTFDGGLDTMCGPKVQLTRLAKSRQKCLAIMNAPAIKEFIASTDPRFTEEATRENPKPVLNTRYIADGGNLSLGPSKTFTLPDEFNGAKFAGFFSPFFMIRENGKNHAIPPAADVSNLFVQKFINGTPFAIVAGPRRGVISNPLMVGLEYDFLLADREYIEPMGINPIVKKKGVGYMIYGNQMAYQRTHSAFNNLHVRDLLITIEEAVEDVLASYLFEFNDSSTRLEIKTIVERYLDGVRSNGGIYNFQVTMDESNNPPEVIDNNTGILDIALEPARGIHKFISRVTVTKTGGASAGGFIFA